MRKYLALLMTIILSVGLFFNHAEARRFGGGKSFGVQRSSSSFTRSPQNSSFSNQKYSQQQGGMGRWLGPIAGLITGGLLASLLMGNGIASGITTWLLLGLATFFLINYFRNRTQANISQNKSYQNYQSEQLHQQASFNENPYYRKPIESHNNHSPEGFNTDSFLRNAKVQFIRLQAAYDQKNLGDLRQFTAPEVFAEIQMQLNERGNVPNHTEIINLNAEVLDVTQENSNLLATVRFSGTIKEDPNQPANAFKETWHFQQETFSKNWIVVGIQQE